VRRDVVQDLLGTDRRNSVGDLLRGRSRKRLVGYLHGIELGGGVDENYQRQFVGANIDWRGLVCQSEQASERRAEQWRIYNEGTAEEIADHFPGRRLERFDDFILKMIDRGELTIVEPGIVRKAKNFAKAVRRDGKRGRLRVPREVRTERMTICRACPLYNRAKGWCKHPKCGCLMTRKTHWASAECPVGKWGEWFLPIVKGDD